MLVAVNKFHQVYSLSLRSTTQHNHIQWYKFHVKGVQGLLRRIENQIEICICSTSEIKKQLLAPLEKAKHAWVDELPSVLWSLRTTPNAATQEIPFFLVHGTEAVLPVEITHEAPRIAAYDEATSTEALQDDVDALDEARDVALVRATQYQQNLRNYHSSRVRPRSFVVGDLVL
jgi:hypothetical protein